MNAETRSTTTSISEERRYALSHLAYHLQAADLYTQLEHLVSKSWLDLQIAEGDGKTAFFRDVSLAIQSASVRPDLSLSEQLLQVWRGAYICTCVRSASGWSPSLVRLLAEAGRSTEAKAFATLTSDPYQRSVSFCRIAECALRASDAGAALDAAEKALAAAGDIPSVVTRTDGLANVIDLALKLRAEKILAAGFDLLSRCEMGHWMENILCKLAQAAALARRPELLDKLLALARRLTRDNPDLTSAETTVLCAIAEALVPLGRPEPIREILRIARAKTDPRPAPRLLGALLVAFGSVGDVDSVDAILHSIDSDVDAEDQGDVLARGAEALYRLGDKARVETLVARSIEAADAVKDPLRRDWALCRAAETCARIERFDRATNVAASIVKPQRRSKAFVSLGRIAVLADKIPISVEMAGRAIESARLVDLEDFDAIYGPIETLLQAAVFAWDIGLEAEALGIAHEMLGIPGGLCDPTYGPAGLQSAVRIVASARDRSGLGIAIDLAEGLQDVGFRDQALNTTATALARAGFLDWAVSVSQSHDTGASRAVLAEEALTGGHREQALGLIDAALEEANALGPVNAQALALSHIAYELSMRGAAEQAQRVAMTALGAAKAMQAESFSEHIGANGIRAVVLAQIALTLARTGLVGDATEVALESWAEASPQAPRVRSSLSFETWAALVSLYGRQDEVMRLISRVLAGTVTPEMAFVLARQSSDSRGVIREAMMAMGAEWLSNGAMTRLAVVEKLRSCARAAELDEDQYADILAEWADGDLDPGPSTPAYEQILRGIDVIDLDETLGAAVVQALEAHRPINDVHAMLEPAAHGPERIVNLSRLAMILHQRGRDAEAVQIWKEACALAKEEDRTTMFRLLDNMVPALAAHDGGLVLFRLYLAEQDASAWWRSAL
ncbi:hypothetical protein BRAO375_4680021 [Bradyrhizobium sp. ORS 375]|uniref:hypothetical protein n=1 Tax=Bradyrhizobium sp. (strain ORS 375) TaxID=566679 RepID=UPI0002408077|nr:hypothetical protein [Bradyrhizobium sp. ORS 375]CCD95764.1 hypothetical protein BRAO375_4680021 [Bradyrhizobium sp. ORS 375]